MLNADLQPNDVAFLNNAKRSLLEQSARLAFQTNGKTLFIATWSLSEVPVDFRDQVVTHFSGSDFLVVFQNHIFEIDNQDYFINTFPYLANVFYRLKPIEWHHGGGGNFYLIGRKISST
ncbi:MAG: hypothetical protein WBN97_05670 [Parvibaculum sp.]